MDYKQYLEKFVEDFRKEFDQKQLYEQKIDELNNQHSELMQKLDSLISALNYDKQQNNSLFLDNNQFSKLMNKIELNMTKIKNFHIILVKFNNDFNIYG